MTRKDYVLIAAALRREISLPELISGGEQHAATIAWEMSCDHVADALANDNPRFDRSRFLTACGVQS